MRKHILPILLVLLMILLAGCSKPSELPQNTEIISSSVGQFSELKQDEDLTDEPSISTMESTASSTENKVVSEPTESREKEDKKSKAMEEIKKLTAYRTHLRNEIRKVNIDDDSLSTAKLKISAITERLSELRKDVRLCDAIAERSGVMQENLEKVLAEEEKIKGKENRSYEQRR